MKQENVTEKIVIRNYNNKKDDSDKKIRIELLISELNEMKRLIELRDASFKDGESEILITLDEGSFKVKLLIKKKCAAEFGEDDALRQELLKRRSLKKLVKSFNSLKKIYSSSINVESRTLSVNPQEVELTNLDTGEILWSGYHFIYDAYIKTDPKEKMASVLAAIEEETNTSYIDHEIIMGEKIISEKSEVDLIENSDYVKIKNNIENKVKIKDETFEKILDFSDEIEIVNMKFNSKNKLELDVKIISDGEEYSAKIIDLERFGYLNYKKISVDENKKYISLQGIATLNIKTKKAKLTIESVSKIVNNVEITEKNIKYVDNFE